MMLSPFDGKSVTASIRVNMPRRVTAYYTETPESSVQEQRIAFGNSGYRGFAFENSFNERHILAIHQAICQRDEVLAANGVDAMMMFARKLTELADC